MMHCREPAVGEWYRNEEGMSFEVTAVDEENARVGVQHFDGTVEELALDEWQAKHFARREPPADCTAFADEAANGSAIGEEAPQPTVWSGPLDLVDAEH